LESASALALASELVSVSGWALASASAVEYWLAGELEWELEWGSAWELELEWASGWA
jgi:hypothetical protein